MQQLSCLLKHCFPGCLCDISLLSLQKKYIPLTEIYFLLKCITCKFMLSDLKKQIYSSDYFMNCLEIGLPFQYLLQYFGSAEGIAATNSCICTYIFISTVDLDRKKNLLPLSPLRAVFILLSSILWFSIQGLGALGSCAAS